MKYLAILKDSFREARDSVVLLVLLIASTLITLIVAQFSIKPLSAEKTMEQFFPGPGQVIDLVSALNHQQGKQLDERRMPKRLRFLGMYRLVKTELVRGEPNAPESDYTLTIASNQIRPDPDESGLDEVRSIFRGADDLGLIKVAAVEEVPPDPAGPKSQVYRVTLNGTPLTYRIWASEPSLLFGWQPVPFWSGSIPMGFLVYALGKIVISPGSWVAVLLGVVVSAFFVPNMLRKGTIDMLLVKPVHRWTLLLYKYVGGLTFILIINTYAIGSIWLILGLRTGLWVNSALLMILTLTFYFAVLYAFSVLVSVLTRSTIVTILLTIGIWFLFGLSASLHEFFRVEEIKGEIQKEAGLARHADEDSSIGWFAEIAHGAYAITPRTSDLNVINDLLVYCGCITGRISDMDRFNALGIVWWQSLLIPSCWIAVCLAFACFWFAYRDY